MTNDEDVALARKHLEAVYAGFSPDACEASTWTLAENAARQVSCLTDELAIANEHVRVLAEKVERQIEIIDGLAFRLVREAR